MRWGSSVILVISLLSIPKLASAAPTFLYYYCSNHTSYAATDSTYPKNVNSVFQSLSSAVATSTNGFTTAVAGNGTDHAVFGLFLCRGDQTTTGCSDCVKTAVSDRPKKATCARSKLAIMWYDECMIRYDNDNFFGRMDQVPGLGLWNTQNITGNQTQFGELLGSTLIDVATETANGGPRKKYGTKTVSFSSFQTLYVLEQCTPDLSTSDCNLCLTIAIAQMLLRKGGRIILPSCSFRYEVYEINPFFIGANNNSSPPPSSSSSPPPSSSSSPPPSTTNSSATASSETGHGNSTTKEKKAQVRVVVIVAITISTSILISLSFGIRICIKRRKPNEGDREAKEISSVECLQFDINTIRAATQNFSSNNKLGKGGFGEVYKGKLESGQEVAIKRLLQISKQGIREFETEIALVAKLQHKNLVKLLGFCLTSKEKILVYELLPNSSLDRSLFDGTSNTPLDWQTRLNIIIGIARGLMYLHEDSRLTVIHRDLKTSNILLDHAMNPKISDFGLAKLFEEDQTQGDTGRIVGTYGYMAPEYAVTGHYSVKSDIYSFGVIVLEIISGEKNRFFGGLQLKEALLHRAWRLWNENKPIYLIDKTLNEDFSHEELIRCYHIGLLCIQEDATQRPGMRLILDALSRPSISLQEPTAPRFFGNLIKPNKEIGTPPHTYSGTETITYVNPRD